MMTQNERMYIPDVIKGLMKMDEPMRNFLIGYGTCLNDIKEKDESYFKGYAMAVMENSKGA